MLQKKTVKSVFDQMTKDLKAIRQKQKVQAAELKGKIRGLNATLAVVDEEYEKADRAITNIEALFTKEAK